MAFWYEPDNESNDILIRAILLPFLSSSVKPHAGSYGNFGGEERGRFGHKFCQFAR